MLNLFVGQFRINRQAQAFAGGLFRNRKIPRLVAERRVTLLQVQRQRIVQRATNLVRFKMFFQVITPWMAHYVQVINAFRKIRLARQLQRRVRQQFVIFFATRRRPSVHLFRCGSFTPSTPPWMPSMR